MHPITMADLAKHAGVDQSTISLALRNSSRISAETRDKIHKLAEELGYRPNPLVSALMRNRRKRLASDETSVVAWITSWPTQDGWLTGGPIFKAFFDGTSERLIEYGFRTEHFWFDKKSFTPSRFSNIILARGITGVIIAPVPSEDPELKLDWDKFSSVTLGRSLRSPLLDRVDAAHFEGISTLIRQCKKLGYKRIGLTIDHVLIERFERRWLAGYVVNAPDQNDEPLLEVFKESLSRASSVQNFHLWFKKNNPDVIITVSRRDGVRLIELLENDLGKSVPRDIGVVILSCQTEDDTVSGIFQFPKLLGNQAAEILVRKIMLNEVGLPEHPLSFSINGMWNPGTTVRSQLNEDASPWKNSPIPVATVKAAIDPKPSDAGQSL